MNGIELVKKESEVGNSKTFYPSANAVDILGDIKVATPTLQFVVFARRPYKSGPKGMNKRELKRQEQKEHITITKCLSEPCAIYIQILYPNHSGYM